MKRVLLLLTGWAVLAPWLYANGGETFPFHVGEKLVYQVYWGPLVAGRATLKVTGIDVVDGNECYHIVAEVRTSGIIDLLFHVDNKTESWFDVDELCTRRFRQVRVEGKHRRADDSRYDYVTGRVVTTNLVTGREKTAPLDGAVQDVISCLYYVRTQPLQLDVAHTFPVNISGSRYEVTVRPDQRKTLFFRPVGDVSALRIEPSPTLTVVAANKGRMWFWVSDDARKLPLLLTSDMKIGSARLVLLAIESANPTLDRLLRRRAAAHTNIVTEAHH